MANPNRALLETYKTQTKLGEMPATMRAVQQAIMAAKLDRVRSGALRNRSEAARNESQVALQQQEAQILTEQFRQLTAARAMAGVAPLRGTRMPIVLHANPHTDSELPLPDGGDFFDGYDRHGGIRMMADPGMVRMASAIGQHMAKEAGIFNRAATAVKGAISKPSAFTMGAPPSSNPLLSSKVVPPKAEKMVGGLFKKPGILGGSALPKTTDKALLKSTAGKALPEGAPVEKVLGTQVGSGLTGTNKNISNPWATAAAPTEAVHYGVVPPQAGAKVTPPQDATQVAANKAVEDRITHNKAVAESQAAQVPQQGNVIPAKSGKTHVEKPGTVVEPNQAAQTPAASTPATPASPEVKPTEGAFNWDKAMSTAKRLAMMYGGYKMLTGAASKASDLLSGESSPARYNEGAILPPTTPTY